MSERNLKQDLIALAIGAFVVFLTTALLTYHANDKVEPLISPLNHLYQADVVQYPQSTFVQNMCGPLGATTADLLFSLFGFGACYLVGSLGVLVVALLRRVEVDSPAIRIGGWAVSCVGVCTCLALTIPLATPGPVYGSGGMLGAMTHTALTGSFATTGGLIIGLSMFFGGMMLATDYMLIGITTTALKYIVKTFDFLLVSTTRFLWQHRPTGLPRRRGKVLDVIDVDDLSAFESATPDTLSVRISGRDEVVVEEDAELDAFDHFDEVDEVIEVDVVDEEEEVVVAPRRRRQRKKLPRPHFKIRRKQSQKQPPVAAGSPEESERAHLMSSLEKASVSAEQFAGYEMPSQQLLDTRVAIDYDAQEKQIRKNAKTLEKTFDEFGFDVKVVDVETGPVIAQYEVALAAGLRLSKISGLADDLAIALRVPSVRIVAPIPGKNTVGIEVPNAEQQLVRMREVIEDANGISAKMNIPIFLGKDVAGNSLTVDLTKMPHLLIAGRTGSGKSVCLHTIIASILMARKPDDVRLLMIDPKMVELSIYSQLPHLMHPVVTDMKKAEAILAWAVEKMEERYRLLALTKVRHVTSFNELGEEEIRKRLGPKIAQMDEVPTHMPFIVIIADELADLMMTAGKDVEQHIIRLAQKSRAVGIHLILATQKPTVDVITGLIKSNLPARLAFQVASHMDSRVVLDEGGAEKLLGNGDMLFLWPGTSTVIRGQGTFLADDEIQSLVDQCSQVEQEFEHELVNLKVDQENDLDPRTLRKRDELYESAIEVVLREGRGSCSLLQRALGIGYGRAARLVDYMAEDGIVGDHNGSSAREVLLTMEEWDALQNASEVTTDEEMEDAELMIEYDSEQIDEDFDDAEWGEAEDDDDLEWEEQEDEETVSISIQSSLIANADDDAEDWADELDSEYNE
ncbi:MAG TPA: DNA translocase FtsK [Planctomycetes bacterium]|nr:DNA translocase FtsK [Planctomycetaceae bacterium]HIN53364.1 DNA translocase FtsK [Planctomycetota bacterium]